MGQRLGRQSSNNLSFESVDQQLPPIVQHPPCVSDAPANASRQAITPSTTTLPATTTAATAAVIIKIQLLKMESNNLNGNGNGATKPIVDPTTTTTSLVGAYEQLALRPPADVMVAAAIVPPPITNNSTEYVPMSAPPRINNNQPNDGGNNLNRNNNLVRSLTGSSESDNTISNSNNSICSSSNNNAAGTLNIVCDSNKINNLSKVSQASQPQQQPHLQHQQQQNQRNFNITTSEPNREIYTMMYAANSGGTSGGSAQQIVQDEDLLGATNTRNSCNHCSRRRTLAALARRSRVCKLCHESLDDNSGAGKAKEKTGGKDKDGAKPKKANWGIKFNCAKLRGNSSKASTSVAATVTPAPPSPPVSNASSDCLTSPSYTNLLSPAETPRTFDSCVCTGYRKVDDSESERSESEYEVRPQHVTTTRTSVSLFSTTTTMGPEGTTSRTSTIVLPDHRTTTSIPANFVATAPTATSLTVATMSCNGQVIQRFERTDHYGNNPTLGTNNVILVSVNPPMIDVTKFNADDYPIEDCDEQARRQRAYEIAEGVEPPPGFTPSPTSTIVLNPSVAGTAGQLSCAPTLAYNSPVNVTQWCTPDAFQEFMNLQMPNAIGGNTTTTRIHSQVDYIHCLVPDLQKITGCCFYWGKMDRYEAEKLLEGKPEGTFLLRDSAQEDFLFSVSFRKYGRSLHARIEQFNHKFSFDSHDPGVYTASTVTGLLEHYKDPSCVMFFEPMLTLPLNRNFCFSLQQLCRATIVSHITYDGINELCLPQRLRSYLQEYHYKQRLRVKKFDDGGIYAKTS